MAPSPEYDKEPKAPDKAVVNISSDDSKVLYNHTKDHSSISELRSTATPANSDVENKHVETLDDGQLRALLDEAITYKCPKDREGKSSLFKELLEEVEQDEEVCEAAVRVLRGGRRGARGRREHHSSLQDLVAAMTAEPAPRRRHHHHSHASSSSSNVSARTHHGGSLPSGVDTSFLLSEEPTRGGYLATVRCVNPPPLAERRVSASDANTSTDELVTRRSKPTFPMTYTARATLEIGSGSVGSGRAVTTTTASNQVRTTTATPRRPAARRPATRRPAARRPAAAGPSPRTIGKPHDPYTNQTKLMSALRKRVDYPCDSGGIVPTEQSNEARPGGKECEPRGSNSKNTNQYNNNDSLNSQWKNSVDKWYESLDNYTNKLPLKNVDLKCNSQTDVPSFTKYKEDASYNTALNDKQQIIFEHGSKSIDIAVNSCKRNDKNVKQKNISNVSKNNNLHSIPYNKLDNKNRVLHLSDNDESDISLRKLYRDRVGNDLVAPNISTIINPKNVRNMTIGKPQSSKDLSVKSSPKGNVNIVLENKETSKVVLEKAITVNAHNPSSENVEIVNDDEKGVAQIENHTSTCKNCSCDSCSSKAKAPEENTNDVPLNFSDDCFKQVDKTENVLEKLIKTYEISQTNDNDEQTPDNNEEISYLVLQDDFMLQLKTEGDGKPFNLAELPNNSYVFLTIPEEFMQAVNNINNQTTIITEIENNNNTSNTKDNNNNKHFEKKSKKRHKKKKKELKTDPNKSDASNKNALKLLLYSDCSDQSAKEQSADSASKTKEVDSAIPFSCITTPEVVASCNTTSTTQSTVAIDPKPLQLESCYRAVSSLTGGAWQPGPAAPPPAAAPAPVPSSAPGAGPTAPATGPADAPAAPPAPAASTAAATVAAHDLLLARNVLTTTTFSGLPLARPSYGSTACSSSDDYKKSLDENGNAVHGFNSPISGSSQHKKPRRKKSSKNETVIKSHQIDGYQGNKDLNEVLRFIESNADGARGPKMRSKHKDDSDDKGKKRCPDRRKDKENKIKRASSLEELSRTKLEDLTDKPNARRWAAAAPAKPERRSWGDDARAALLLPDDSELTDFQTVTKRRKPRRRADEPEPPGDARPPRRPPTPEPRARRASPSNSNDSNDDVDSVHSLPADAPHTRCKPGPPPPPPAQPATAAALAAAAAAAAAAHASYADIARTRNNIPDLIESCNFYSEGEELKDLTSSPNPKATASAAESMEGYPALATKKPRDKPVQTATRSQRRERAESRTVEPAPDVVADRRPPVILLDSAARPRDMDGVTFGFDINEQLLSCAGGAARRPRCDLLRDAPEEGVAVRAGGAALRYVPPAPPPPPRAAHTQLIVDYVGTAWDDIVRCGSGKVRYFSE